MAIDPAWAPVIGQGVSSTGNIISTVLTNQSNREENEKNRAYNLMLANMQNQWNIEQWNRENAYNSPESQMARFKSAGLNPNLIYGQQNTAAPSPELSSGAPSTPMQAIAPTVGDFADAFLKKAQIENLKADTGKKNTETAYTSKQIDALGLEMGLTKETIDLVKSNVEINHQTIENMKQQIAESKSRVALMDEQKLSQYLDNFFKQSTMEDAIKRYQDECKITSAQAKYEALYLVSRIYNIKADTALKDAQKGLTDQEVVESQKRCDQMQTVIEFNGTQNEYIKAELEVYKEYGKKQAKATLTNTRANTVGTFLGAHSNIVGASANLVKCAASFIK